MSEYMFGVSRQKPTRKAAKVIKPHGKRTARLYGLKACPQRGSFGVPRGDGLQYRDDEIKAASERGVSLPMERK